MKSRSLSEMKLRDEQAGTYNEWYLERGKLPVDIEDELIIESLDLDNAKSIIDFGCGTGRLLQKISKKYPELEIFGLDLSSESIRIAKKNIPNGNFYQFDLSEDSYKECFHFKFDRVLSVQAIQHIEKKRHQHAIEQLLSALDNDGKLVCEFYNHFGLNRKFEQIRQRNTAKEVHRGHFFEYRFTPFDWRKYFVDYDGVMMKVIGCQCIPRGIINRFKFLKGFDIALSKSFLGILFSYYFIFVLDNNKIGGINDK